MKVHRSAVSPEMNSQSGMSLIEILIVITLIAVAGSFVAGRVFDSLQEGNASAAKAQMNGLRTAMEDFRRLCNNYPSTEQGLEALIAKPSSGPECPNYPASAFLQDGKVPKDPWDTPYQYESDGKKFVITSYGRDKKEGGEGFDKDLHSND